MRILLSGGGTGGHITPLLAVAHEIKRIHPDCEIIYVGERGGKFAGLAHEHASIDKVYTIWAGKFRRYHGEPLLSRLLDFKTNLLNLRDAFYFLMGALQSWILLGKIRPDAVFLKGGFVGVPVGIAAAARKLPFITHDSDILPGLANRIVGRWALKHAVAEPVSEYAYPPQKTVQVGVLVQQAFKPVTARMQAEYKKQINVPPSSPLLLITGGSSGAQRLNEAVQQILEGLLNDYKELHVVHQVGKGKAGSYEGFAHERVQVVEFMSPMHVYTGAADIVVSRASATTMAELGVQGKAVIAVANPFLTEGHQVKNALRWQEKGMVVSVSEDVSGTNAAELDVAIRRLLADSALREKLAHRLRSNTITDASNKIAMLLLDVAKEAR